MNVSLYRHELDDDDYPELRQAPGQRGVRARVTAGAAEPRLPAAARSARRVLLVVFRLAASPVAGEWSLSFDVPDAAGRPRNVRLQLHDEPMDGNATERPQGDPSAPLPPGLIYRGAFWVDLDAMAGVYQLAGGAMLTLHHGGADAVEVVWPG